MDEVYDKAVDNMQSLYEKYGLSFDDVRNLTALDAHVFKVIERGHKSIAEIEDILRKFYKHYSHEIPLYDDELKPLNKYINDSINKLIEDGFLTENLDITEKGKKLSDFINNEVMSVREIESYLPEAVKKKNIEKPIIVVDCDGVALNIKKGDITVRTVFSAPLDILELYFNKNPEKFMEFIEFNNNLIKNSLKRK